MLRDSALTLSYETFLTRTGGVKQRSSTMFRWIGEILIAVGLIAKVRTAIQESSAFVELFLLQNSTLGKVG